jgi:hypothetical protein
MPDEEENLKEDEDGVLEDDLPPGLDLDEEEEF